MPRLDTLRDRLPSLWRPDADDVAPELGRLAPADILGVDGPGGSLSFAARPRGDGALFLDLAAPSAVAAVRLRPSVVPGAGWALELHRLDGHGAIEPKPAAVADVHGTLAVVPRLFEAQQFGLLLRRRDLLTLTLVGTGDALDRLGDEAAAVMQAHWFSFADRAVYDPWFLRTREFHDPPLGTPAPDETDVLEFPYIADLGRLASLLSLPPWQGANGGGIAESVEAYRQRIGRIVSLYVDGLGTIDALRRMTEAQLPVDLEAPPERRDRPFAVEEHAALSTEHVQVLTPGEPVDLLGPLMHWRIANDGVEPVAPTVYVQAPSEADRAAAKGSVEDATTPLIERFDPAAAEVAVGVAYTGTLAPGTTLRLRPTHASWLGRQDGLRVASGDPAADDPDPTVPGPWTAAGGAPAKPVTALVQTAEHALWLAVESDGSGTLWRHDGSSWTVALDGTGAIHCLAEDGSDLLIGAADGLRRLQLFRGEDEGFTVAAVTSVGDVAVNDLLRTADGTRWVATATGIGRLGDGDGFEPVPLGGATEIRCLADDVTGAVYAGGAPGLFQLQPAHGAVYWYGGGSADDEDPEWNDLAAAGFPADADVHLPAVTCVRRTRDGTLWIGTAAGLARYLARSERGPLAYRTQLEAFPDLVPDAVSAIVEDERGLVWFGTDRGVFRFDGRDLFQYRESVDTWDQLGRADTLYDGSAKPPARGIWRYVRADNAWERFAAEAPLPDWAVFAGEVRSAEETAVTTIAFTDGVAAELLDAWDPSDFSAGTSTPVDPSQLELRCKPPGYEQIVAGGIPALPRLPPGESSWRYLSLEPSDLVPPASLPAWTIEGRLLRETTPPPDAEPDPGRWDETAPDADAGEFDEAVFAFAPAARVGFEWRPRRARAVLARLATRSPADVVEPAVLDRVWQGLQQVRPAGVHAALAVDETIVRKET